MRLPLVALRRPSELPSPFQDGLPTRPIGAHSRDKLHYWGCYLEAASTATSRTFSGARVCADFFAGHGVCHDKRTGDLSWGSALLSLQVAVPFDLYFFNDIDPEATTTLAARARALGISGAHVFELDLRRDDALRRASEIATVVVPWGPRIVVATGDANAAHLALKRLMPEGKRYMCCVIDPQSAIYEWQALEALVFRERAIDVLELFPDEMDLGRGLPYYLRPGRGAKLDNYFPSTSDWRRVAQESARPTTALRRLYEEEMRRLLDLRVGYPKTVSLGGRALYRLIFATRAELGIKLWNDICRRTPGQQDELPLVGV